MLKQLIPLLILCGVFGLYGVKQIWLHIKYDKDTND
jgi:hypothetical protein